MKPPKPIQSLAGQKCPACEKGTLALVQVNHNEEVADDNAISIPDIWVDRCDSCEEIFFPGQTTRYIESVVADQTEQLTPRELERIREDLGVQTQDEMSEILGLGIKTYHKWESGAQFPTRSMSNYIRLLAGVPDAFDYLKTRAWRNKNRLLPSNATMDPREMFPDWALSQPASVLPVPGQFTPRQRANPALGLTRVVFVSK